MPPCAMCAISAACASLDCDALEPAGMHFREELVFQVAIAAVRKPYQPQQWDAIPRMEEGTPAVRCVIKKDEGVCAGRTGTGTTAGVWRQLGPFEVSQDVVSCCRTCNEKDRTVGHCRCSVGTELAA